MAVTSRIPNLCSLAFSLVALGALPAAAADEPADFLVGVIAHSRGDYETALATFGDPSLVAVPEAQGYLGRMYLMGQGVEPDPALGLALLAEAAAGGDLDAALLLAKVYDFGVGGVPADRALATSYWLRAAELGNRDAMVQAGMRFMDGDAKGQPDYGQAAHWLGLAAAAGDARAMTYLADLYAAGHGRPGDERRSEDLYRTAAGKGNSLAMERLARSIVTEGGDLSEARSLAETAVLREGQPAFHDTLGTILKLQGDLAGAEQQFRLAMKKSPLYAQAREHLGDLYWEQGRRLEAKALWQEARDLARDHGTKARIEAKLERL